MDGFAGISLCGRPRATRNHAWSLRKSAKVKLLAFGSIEGQLYTCTTTEQEPVPVAEADSTACPRIATTCGDHHCHHKRSRLHPVALILPLGINLSLFFQEILFPAIRRFDCSVQAGLAEDEEAG
jgi:hypothetical protein